MRKILSFIKENYIMLIAVLLAAAVSVTMFFVIKSKKSVPTDAVSTVSVHSEVSKEESRDISSAEESMSAVSSASAPLPASSKQAPAPVSSYSGPYSSVISEANKYKNTRYGYGFGLSVDAANRPTVALDQQYTYGKYGMMTIDTSVTNENKVIYLTFDEGYENGYTESILDTLRDKDCSATFFITKGYCNQASDLVNRMINEGHVIGNHSVNHYDMTTISTEKAVSEITDLHDYVKKTYGYEMHLFRPPTGAYSERSLKVAQLLGYTTVEWSFAYKDWDPDTQPDKNYAYDYITSKTCNGGIYLLHAVSKTNAEILGDLIDYWRNEGYTVKAFQGS